MTVVLFFVGEEVVPLVLVVVDKYEEKSICEKRKQEDQCEHRKGNRQIQAERAAACPDPQDRNVLPQITESEVTA